MDGWKDRSVMEMLGLTVPVQRARDSIDGDASFVVGSIDRSMPDISFFFFSFLPPFSFNPSLYLYTNQTWDVAGDFSNFFFNFFFGFSNQSIKQRNFSSYIHTSDRVGNSNQSNSTNNNHHQGHFHFPQRCISSLTHSYQTKPTQTNPKTPPEHQPLRISVLHRRT